MAQAWRQIPDTEPLAAGPPAMRGVVPLVLCLRHGGTAHVDLRYEVVGDPAASIVIVAGGISAGRHTVASADFPEPGWWQGLTESLDESLSRAKQNLDLQAKFQQLQQQAEQWAIGVINLIVIFLLEVLLIPIVLLWIMFTVIRSLLLKN